MTYIKLAYPQLLEDAERRQIERAASAGDVQVRVKERKPNGEVILEAVLPWGYYR